MNEIGPRAKRGYPASQSAVLVNERNLLFSEALLQERGSSNPQRDFRPENATGWRPSRKSCRRQAQAFAAEKPLVEIRENSRTRKR